MLVIGFLVAKKVDETMAEYRFLQTLLYRFTYGKACGYEPTSVVSSKAEITFALDASAVTKHG